MTRTWTQSKHRTTNNITTSTCSGITHGRVLNGELYAQTFQKLIYLHSFTDGFKKISPQPSQQIQLLNYICSDD